MLQYASVLPDDLASASGIREGPGCLAGGLATVTAAVAPAVRNPAAAGEAFALLARPSHLSSNRYALTVARVAALASAQARASLRSGAALLELTAPLPAAALHLFLERCVTGCLGEEEWARLAGQARRGVGVQAGVHLPWRPPCREAAWGREEASRRLHVESTPRHLGLPLPQAGPPLPLPSSSIAGQPGAGALHVAHAWGGRERHPPRGGQVGAGPAVQLWQGSVPAVGLQALHPLQGQFGFVRCA